MYLIDVNGWCLTEAEDEETDVSTSTDVEGVCFMPLSQLQGCVIWIICIGMHIC